MICDNCKTPICPGTPDLQLKLKDCFIVCMSCFDLIDNHMNRPDFYGNEFEESKL